MDKELINTLKYVLDDALKPIHHRLDRMDKRIGGLEVELKEFRSETKTALQLIQSGQRGTREEMTQRFNETREGFQRIEADLKFVNHKTADHELKFNRLESESKENRQ